MVVKGKKSDLKRFMKAVEGKEKEMNDDGKKVAVVPLSFETIHPTPKVLTNTDSPSKDEKLNKANIEKYGYGDWYEFHIGEWGTKWDLGSDTRMTIQKDSILYSFASAWSPPISIVSKLAKRFPMLSFELTYCEPGMAFAGVFTAEGKEEEDACYNQSDAVAEYRKIAEPLGCWWEPEEEEEN